MTEILQNQNDKKIWNKAVVKAGGIIIHSSYLLSSSRLFFEGYKIWYFVKNSDIILMSKVAVS